MVQKSPIKNEHYEAFRAGRFRDIPTDVLELLRAKDAHEEVAAAAVEAVHDGDVDEHEGA